MTARQITFVKECLPSALEAGAAYRMNPRVLLAQAALESGWGDSSLAREHRNYFGLTAYGASNQYWHGGKTTVATRRYTLSFRHYDSVRNSFLDFARLIRDNYRSAWAVSEHPEAYANEIAYSPYISELNGDDRAAYRATLVRLSQTIEAIIALIR